MATELVIFTDESDKEGEYFSNFYGGVLIRSVHLRSAIHQLQQVKTEQNLFGEIKWQKVTGSYLNKYIAVMDAFFDLVSNDIAKVRIMFTNNQYIPVGLSVAQRKNQYHLLYYQFIKHAFGLQFASQEHNPPIRIRLNLDQMPTSNEDTDKFKSYIEALHRNPQMRSAGLMFDAQQIAEVDSKDHVLLQCLDVVLGSMSFRLNNKHQIKPEGQHRRGKKTIAKEKLYRHILNRVRQVYANFNIGESTGQQGNPSNRWSHPYRHWKMVPSNHERDRSRAKPKP